VLSLLLPCLCVLATVRTIPLKVSDGFGPNYHGRYINAESGPSDSILSTVNSSLIRQGHLEIIGLQI